jgi:hypothetical protein
VDFLFSSPGVLRLGLGEFHDPCHTAPLGAAEDWMNPVNGVDIKNFWQWFSAPGVNAWAR